MKNPLLKSTFREIKGSIGRFLSIFAIITLGVAFFGGINSASPDMKNTADKYYDDYNFMDFKLLSTTGFSKENVTEIKNLSFVQGILPTYSVDALKILKNDQPAVRIHGLPFNLDPKDSNYINQVRLIEGRLPKASSECVVQKQKNDSDKTYIGGKIKLDSGNINNPIENSLETDEYTIVGFVESPYYMSIEDRASTSIGSGKISSFVMIPIDNFKIPKYTELLITVKGAKNLDTYSNEYKTLIKNCEKSLENIGKDQTQSSAFYALSREKNYSYVSYEQSADTINAIAKVFPVFFFFIAAMVCLTTMTRMVEEQRTEIGTLKALGYSRQAIASKYILYSLLASVSGSIVGLAIGFTMFPTVIFDAYGIMFSLPNVLLSFNTFYAILATGTAICVTTLSAYFACYSELKETPALLMVPKSPKMGKKILLERIKFIWKRMNFTKKVTARNIFRYKKRFLMTTIGIAGCTALLLAAFGIRDSIQTIVDVQYGELIKYDSSIYLNNSNNSVDNYNIEKYISNNSKITDSLLISQEEFDITNGNLEEKIALIVPKNLDDFDDFLTIRTRLGKKTIAIEENAIVLSEKLAKLLEVKVGDEITLENKYHNPVTIKVSNIFENYINHYSYMSKDTYETLLGSKFKGNQLISKLKNTDDEFQETLSTELMTNKEISSVSFNTLFKNNFKDTIKSLGYVVFVMILSAGALAFVVLYNLTNVNISERKREIATIKVLGFYDREVSSYVYKENLILTLIGIVIGLLLGTILHRFIISTAELGSSMFGRTIGIWSYVISFLLTLGFAILVNFFMYYKLKSINMVESLKSID